MKVNRVQYANLFGDPRGEQIRIEKDQTGSEIIKLGIPQGQMQHGQIPKYQDVEISPRSSLQKDTYTTYVIDDIGTADFDGDGQLDLYYTYKQITSVASSNKRHVSQPSNVILFHDDIKKTVQKKLGIQETPLTTPYGNLEWRVRDLEQKVRRLEWNIRDLKSTRRNLNSRITSLESLPLNKGKAELSNLSAQTKLIPEGCTTKENKTETTHPADYEYNQNNYLEYRITELERKLRWKENEITRLEWKYDDLTRRTNALEQTDTETINADTLKIKENTTNRASTNLEFRIWIIENEFNRYDLRIKDLKRKSRHLNRRVRGLEM